MASFRAGKDDSWVRLTFNEGRSLWRDLPTLLPDSPAKTNRAAATLEWALRLQRDESHQPILVAGLSADQSKILRWRCEYMALPLALLRDGERIQQLRDRIAESESLYGELRSLGARVLAEALPDPEHKDTRSHARDLFDSSGFPAGYFSALERALPELLEMLGQGSFEEAHRFWREGLVSSARGAWDQLLASLGMSARALRADAKFQGAFHRILKKYTPLKES